MIAGTVSHGTLREEDLIPAFIEALEELDSNTARYARDEWEELSATMSYMQEHFSWAELNNDKLVWPRVVDHANEMCIELMDALDSFAAPGFYFGTHPGDGSDFGFWEHDEM